MSSTSHHRRSPTASLLLLLAGVLTAIALAEVGLRTYSNFNAQFHLAFMAHDPLASQVEPHGQIGYRQKPNTTFHYSNGKTATSNSMGFRGPSVEIPKPSDVFRIVLFGGSTTHGWNVNDDETIDAYMRILLRQHNPKRAFEVVNLAFDGYDSYQLLERLRTDGVRLDPDLIIVNSGINDVRNARFPDLQDPDPRTYLWEVALDLQRDQVRQRRLTRWMQVQHLSYVARLPALVHTRFRWARRHLGGEGGRIPPNSAAIEYFGRNMWRIVAVVRDRNVPILFSTPPSALTTKFAPNDTSPSSYWLLNAATTEACRLLLAERMRAVVAELTSEDYPTRYVTHNLPVEMFLDDSHLTPEGNRRMAEDFVDAASPYII